MEKQVLNIDTLISKSLDNLETMADLVKSEPEVQELSKSQDDENLNAGEVSEDAPAPEQEDAPQEEAEAPQEDAPEEEGDVDADSEPEEDTDEDEVEKSIESDLRKSENSAKALEVSDFLGDMVKSLDATLKHHTDSISKALEAVREENSEALVKSVEGIFKSQESIMKSHVAMHKSVNAINERLDKLEQQPVVRKSVTNKAQIVEKSFNDSIGVTNGASNSKLSKSEASSKLMTAFSGGNTDLMQDVLALDAGKDINDLSDNARSVLGL
ncbi:hypothetical protein EalM132_00066 [Exiguobacterium phage vB_EalM-132]|nr:hypothetical protein EalM132_00066 [Exiguobacterium phage vB_EalM-132]